MQCDGYWSGLGVELSKFISSKPLVNGISGDDPVFNGAGDLAVQCVSFLHTNGTQRVNPGRFYAVAMDDGDQGYDYEVIGHYPPGIGGRGKVEFVAKIRGDEKFRGDPSDFSGDDRQNDDEDT